MAWTALAFLVVESTLIGYAVCLTLNAQVSTTLVNTFNYAAPVIALFLSALLHEPLTLVKLISGGIALVGRADDRSEIVLRTARRPPFRKPEFNLSIRP